MKRTVSFPLSLKSPPRCVKFARSRSRFGVTPVHPSTQAPEHPSTQALHAPLAPYAQYAPYFRQGSTSFSPAMSLKSAMLRVARVSPALTAMAAICASG